MSSKLHWKHSCPHSLIYIRSLFCVCQLFCCSREELRVTDKGKRGTFFLERSRRWPPETFGAAIEEETFSVGKKEKDPGKGKKRKKGILGPVKKGEHQATRSWRMALQRKHRQEKKSGQKFRRMKFYLAIYIYVCVCDTYSYNSAKCVRYSYAET